MNLAKSLIVSEKNYSNHRAPSGLIDQSDTQEQRMLFNSN
jgi:hypothetical protein